MNLKDFNQLDEEKVKEILFQCCGSTGWVERMISSIPFDSEKELLQKASQIWYEQCTEADWKESFTHHPKIGDVNSLKEKYAGKEQASIAQADDTTIQELANANEEYSKRNGFIFIVCATGKSALEMLRLLNDRLSNQATEEIRIAMGEQAKITVIRLKKLISAGTWSNIGGSQLTTHVLDTSLGRPAKDLTIKLQEYINDAWKTVAQGVTNADGRIADLLPVGRPLSFKNYQMIFQTERYFELNNMKGFYPEVAIQFTVLDKNHYHVPLLLNPFGYSTYRGS